MNISNLDLSSSSAYPTQEAKGNLMTKAIKDYKDQFLTGLTDDEREKIKQKIREYIESIPKGQKLDLAALNALVSSLLKQFGFKGNIDDMIQSLISETAQELKTESSSSSDAVTAYEKLSSCKKVDLQSNNPTDLKESPAEEQTVTHIINNADGSKSLVVIKNNVIISTCKLTTQGDLIKCDQTSNAIAEATAALEQSVATA